jgi:hypothetical protein
VTDAPALVRYCAYAAAEGGSHGHHVEAASFAEAALQFVEVWHPEPDADSHVTVIVCDQESGEQQCFVVDLSAREVEPCA